MRRNCGKIVASTDAGAGVSGDEDAVELTGAQRVINEDVSGSGGAAVSEHHLSRQRVVKPSRAAVSEHHLSRQRVVKPSRYVRREVALGHAPLTYLHEQFMPRL